MHTYNVFNNLSHVLLALLCTTFLPVHGTGLPNASLASQTTPAHRSTAIALPQEGVRLFAKLKRINVRAMEDSDLLQGVVAQEDILRVKKTLQSIYLARDVLPDCIAQTPWISRAYTMTGTIYVLYDILQYIYDRHHSLFHAHQGFATYEAAYQHGIQPSHLHMLDAAIGAAHNVASPYLQDASFCKAFDVLTGGVYKGAMRLSLTCTIPDPNISTQPSQDHLNGLAPMFRWLNGFSPLYLPKGLQTCILVYAYGKSFPSYGRIGTLKDPLLEKPVTYVCEGKTIDEKDIRAFQGVLQYQYIDERSLPHRFVVAHTSQFTLLQKSTALPCMWEYLGFYTLHFLLVHIKKTPSFQLLHEGWTQAHGLCVEKALEERLPDALSLVASTSDPALVAEGFGYLLGVFGVFKVCQEVVDNL